MLMFLKLLPHLVTFTFQTYHLAHLKIIGMQKLLKINPYNADNEQMCEYNFYSSTLADLSKFFAISHTYNDAVALLFTKPHFTTSDLASCKTASKQCLEF
jgi:hypothetical protein